MFVQPQSQVPSDQLLTREHKSMHEQLNQSFGSNLRGAQQINITITGTK